MPDFCEASLLSGIGNRDQLGVPLDVRKDRVHEEITKAPTELDLLFRSELLISK